MLVVGGETSPVFALHDGARVIAEHEQFGAGGIERHLSFNNRHQAIDYFSHPTVFDSNKLFHNWRWV